MAVIASLATGTLSANRRESTEIYEGCGDSKNCWGYYEAESRDCDWTTEASFAICSMKNRPFKGVISIASIGV